MRRPTTHGRVQRPSPAKGIAFISIEDEHGLANLLCYPKINDRAEVAELRRETTERLDRMAARMDERFDRLDMRLAQQTRWSLGVLGLVTTLVTTLLAIERLGLTIQ